MTEPQIGTMGVEIRLDPADDDAEALDALTVALRRDLLDVSVVESVERPSAGPPPPGARGVDLLSVGTLLVTVIQAAGGLQAVAGVVQAWLSGQPDRSVTLTIDGDSIVAGGLSGADQARLVTAFIERHAGS